MTDDGTYLTVDEGEATIADLLDSVRRDGRTIRIVSGGKPVAEVRRPAGPRRLGPVEGEPRLGLSPDYDPEAGVPEEWWPSDQG